MTELVYVRGTRSAEEIQEDVRRFFEELDRSAEVRAELAAAGIDPDVLPESEERAGAVRVGVRGAGLDPTGVALVLSFAPTANTVLITLWKQIILPRIRRRYGRDAVRDERPPQA
ncbi:hypothetical protein [Actinoplanes regularis]|uniref:Uncharacterized protein n=1 Tax=Actinoplanes regularis TaxID=52697 RepID=A0A238W2L9_9ACTN|nr:hypothetical protein [Actinoplanes regularis]GIE91979.1 hypothetical protein Are01nite_84590 [Actinoplanes regularis]SNR39959.1 hypothetical protein SAMN06264365_10245 [Actinoplanes regularis]